MAAGAAVAAGRPRANASRLRPRGGRSRRPPARRDHELRDLLPVEPLRSRIEWLRCFRGIDDLTALTIAAEFGDPRRFPTAPSVMAFTGRIPSEHSSGARSDHHNGHCASAARPGRTGLAVSPPRLSWPRPHEAATRRAPGPIDIAWHAQRRLHRRYRALAARGKPTQHIVTAVARELTGFLWAALTH